MIAAAQPTMNAGNSETYPATGVMVASPAMVPVATPSAVGFPRCAHSISIHSTVAVEGARGVGTKARTALPFGHAERLEQPLPREPAPRHLAHKKPSILPP